MSSRASTKPCSLCGTEKPLTDFYRSTTSHDGVIASCKPCTLQRIAERAALTDEERQAKLDIKRDSRPLPKDKVNCKKCRKCKQVCPVEEFHYSPLTRDRCVSYCKSCERQRHQDRKIRAAAALRRAQEVSA
jgi:NAD-dependent dihydropyrimidine dehydrogenase PreA subunit